MGMLCLFLLQSSMPNSKSCTEGVPLQYDCMSVSKQPCVTQQYYWMYGFKPKAYMYMNIIMFVPHILRRPSAADGMFKFKLSAPHAFSRHVSFVYMRRYGIVGQTKVTKVADLLV